MLGVINIIAGLGWDPEIRGLLTVVLAMAILAGSVWLLLVSNTGTRLGSLIALAGFWGWMFVMGIFWWIYGIGWVGSSPTWEVQDTFADIAGAEEEGIADAFIGNVGDLPDANCQAGTDSFPPAGGVATVALTSASAEDCSPRAIDVLMAYPGIEREIVMQELLNPQDDGGKIIAIADELFGVAGSDNAEVLDQLSQGQRDSIFDELVSRKQAEIAAGIEDANARLDGDPRFLSATDLALSVDEGLANQHLRIDDISLSALKANSTAITDWAEDEGFLDLSGWNLQTTSQAGEAAATADAALRESLFPDGNFVVLDAYQQGGKPKRTGTGMWDRISHKVTSTLQVTHPTNYTVINVQQTLDKEVDPSKPPPIPEADPNQSTYAVVMTRNLGNLRLIPALFTIGSLALFLMTCLVLHWRDLGLREKGVEV